tara:strand:- start:1623 stop:1877 length:255 start_codon:yes stop_codon:yes gene_type:complete
MSDWINEALTIISLLGVGALLAFMHRKEFFKKKDAKPPENRAAKAAGKVIQESFEEEVDRIRSATTGDSPGDDLAALGNARRRR